MATPRRVRVDSDEIPADHEGHTYVVPFTEGWELPVEFSWSGWQRDEHGEPLAHWMVAVRVIDGIPRCVGFELVAAEGRWISAERARPPLATLVEEACLMSAIPAGSDVIRPVQWGTLDEARAAHEEVAQQLRKQQRRPPRKREPVSDARLEEVARVYRENLSTGRPTRAVAEQLYVSRSTAGRLVMEARRRGKLGAAVEQRRPGEEEQ